LNFHVISKALAVDTEVDPPQQIRPLATESRDLPARCASQLGICSDCLYARTTTGTALTVAARVHTWHRCVGADDCFKSATQVSTMK